MKGKDEIIEVVMSRLDLYVIERVKKLREEKNISQDSLSVSMGFSEKFIGSVENPRLAARYNIRHLNLVAKALNCSLHDLLPNKPFDEDLVRVKIKRTKTINKDGSKSKKISTEIVGVQSLKKK